MTVARRGASGRDQKSHPAATRHVTTPPELTSDLSASPAPDAHLAGAIDESPFQLLGRAIAAACADPLGSTIGLQALVVYAVEHARLEGVTFLDLSRALDAWIDASTRECEEHTRWRVSAMVRQWALAEFLAFDVRDAVARPVGRRHESSRERP